MKLQVRIEPELLELLAARDVGAVRAMERIIELQALEIAELRGRLAAYEDLEVTLDVTLLELAREVGR